MVLDHLCASPDLRKCSEGSGYHKITEMQLGFWTERNF